MQHSPHACNTRLCILGLRWYNLEKFECLQQIKLSKNPLILEIFVAVVKWFAVIIDCFDTRYTPSKLLAKTQLLQRPTLGEICVVVGETCFVRKFIPNYSSVVAPISALLCDLSISEEEGKMFKYMYEARPSINGNSGRSPDLPDRDEKARVQVESSGTGVGAVLS